MSKLSLFRSAKVFFSLPKVEASFPEECRLILAAKNPVERGIRLTWLSEGSLKYQLSEPRLTGNFRDEN